MEGIYTLKDIGLIVLVLFLLLFVLPSLVGFVHVLFHPGRVKEMNDLVKAANRGDQNARCDVRINHNLQTGASWSNEGYDYVLRGWRR
jgi:hypothetical protein